MRTHEAPSLRIYIAVFLLCVASLSAEVTITRLLAYKFFFHFVFLVLSISQLGLAAAAAWVFVRRRPTGTTFAYWAMVAFGVSLFAFLLIYAAVPAPPPKLLNVSAIPYVLLCAIALIPSYFAVGCALSALFTCYKDAFNRLYAADLAGASAGCVLCVGVMMALGPVKAIVLTAATALAAAAVLDGGSRRKVIGCSAGAIALALLAWFGAQYVGEGNSEFGTDFQWTHLARTDRRVPGTYVIDGDALTSIHDPDVTDFEYAVGKAGPRVAIIGPGAGPQLRAALQYGAKSVFAVDINPTIIEWDKGIDVAVNGGIFNQPNVEVLVDEGRHALMSRAASFDLIVMHAIDTYTASSMGAYSLSENYLYTVEAFQSYYQHLSDDGMLSVRRWLFYPPRETFRLFTTALAGLAAEGVRHPERHVVVVSPERNFRNPELKKWGYLLLFRSELREAQLDAIDNYLERNHWAYVYRPDRELDTPLSEYVRAANRDAYIAQYEYNVAPCYDANPFFFQLVRPLAFLFPAAGQSASPLYNQSTVVLFATLVTLIVLTTFMLWLPLRYYRKTHALPPPQQWIRVYFCCLGFGFMAAEMAALQVFALFLGHPTYALSVILLGLLAFAGLGSLLCVRISARLAPLVCLVVAGLAVASAYGLLPAVHRFIGLSFPARIGLTLAYLAVIGVPLGMPMSLGIRQIEGSRPFDVAWAWACNGAAGLLATNICMILMVYFGTAASFAIAVAAYLLACVALAVAQKNSPKAPIANTTVDLPRGPLDANA